MWWVGVAAAAEGMWLPGQIPELAEALDAHGITIPRERLADPSKPPLSAIVSLGGCSASFVSPRGLILTNQHCVRGYLSASSTPELDRIATGHGAAAQADELPAGPTARLRIVEAIEDVTPLLEAVIRDPQIADGDRVAAVDLAKSRLVAKCEKQKGRSCRVVPLFGGKLWQLQRSLELRDVRVVFVPPDTVAGFGGDRDNFEWPRHDADFAFVRAYVGPDGKPADPSPKNVPYDPPNWLRADPTGVREGEGVFVAGYPGGTERWVLPEALRFEAEVGLPARLARFEEVEGLLAKHAAERAGRSALAAKAASTANGRKYAQGVADNLASSPVLDVLEARMSEVERALAADPSREVESRAIAQLRALQRAERDEFASGFVINGLQALSLLRVAHDAVRFATERQIRDDAAREPGLQERDRDELEAAFVELQPRLWLPFERDLAEARLWAYWRLPPADHVAEVDAWITAKGGVDGAVEALFSSPALGQPAARSALLDASLAALQASRDPWVELALAVETGFWAQRRKVDRERRGKALRATPLLVQALTHGRVAYPDANNTLRLTFGRVEGYSPRDGLLATPQTKLCGLVAKHRSDDYEAPAAFAEDAERACETPDESDRRWLDPALGQVPVNFLSSVDTTGGNSGSPTLDGEGNLVGVLFDGNYESMAADWLFDVATTRSVHVDLRYIGWVLSQEPGAASVLRELFGG